MEKLCEIQLPVSTNNMFLWVSHTPLWIVYDCLCPTDRACDQMRQRPYGLQGQEVLLSGLYRKSLPFLVQHAASGHILYSMDSTLTLVYKLPCWDENERRGSGPHHCSVL